MQQSLAFDIYGTLINTQGVLNELNKLIGDQALPFSNLWRDKQLEYTFRRGLMRDYQNFSVCTRQALDYCCSVFQVDLSLEQKDQLMAQYAVLPAFDDVLDCLTEAIEQGYRLYAFSNGSRAAVSGLLSHAGIDQFFDDIISVDEIQTFKPNPDVYQHLLKRTLSTEDNCWLVSSNPFDVIGAANAGLKTAWIQRNAKTAFDPWGVNPSLTLPGLLGLSAAIKKA